MAEAKKTKSITKFEELRRRAQARGDKLVDDIVLFDEEDGFDPPIVVKRMSLAETEKATRLAQREPFASYRIIIGSENYDRIIEQLGDAADMQAISEIHAIVQDRLYGPGASEAPGGSSAS